MKKDHFIWVGYADLMTSLFFVMLVLFVLTVVRLNNKVKATEAELAKIKLIQESVKKIDPEFFTYNEQYKKHILSINVEFQYGKADMTHIPLATRLKLLEAGNSIKDLINQAPKGAQYLLVIEGQASKDGASQNDELSYRRALALRDYWQRNAITLSSNTCEVLVAGSGERGVYRVQPDNADNAANRRFLIHIIPKPGVVGQLP